MTHRSHGLQKELVVKVKLESSVIIIVTSMTYLSIFLRLLNNSVR